MFSCVVGLILLTVAPYRIAQQAIFAAHLFDLFFPLYF